MRRYTIAAIAALTAASAQGAPATSEFADTLVALPAVSVTQIKTGRETPDDQTVTTLDHVEIERLNIVNLKQVSEIAPNFYMPQYGSRMTSSVYVRGLGTRIDQPAVGLNIDNVPIINKDNFDFDLSDIERIEILRGPQNILFGRNTMGGLINIHTLSPLNFQGVRIMGEYGSRNSYKASAGIYGRHGERFGNALNLYATGTDGWWRNALTGARIGKERQWSARWKSVWRAGSEALVSNAASVSHSSQSGYPYRSVATGQIAYNDTCFYRRLTVTDGLTAKVRAGEVDLSGIASFQYINDNMTLDQDFTPADLFTLSQIRHEWAATADIVARGKAGREGAYRWVAGVFGFYRRGNMDAPVRFFDSGISELIEKHSNEQLPRFPIRWDQRELPLLSSFVNRGRGASVYHQSELTIGNLELTAGIRFDWENPRLTYHAWSSSSYTRYDVSTDPPQVVTRSNEVTINDHGMLSRHYSQLLPKFTASWKLPSDWGNIFASVTKGYKSGGYNTQMFSDVLQQRIKEFLGLVPLYDIDRVVAYEPEKTWNYEVGAHLRLAGGRLTIDAALFRIDVRDQQLTTFPDGTVTGRVMTNAGKSRSQGVELTLGYRFGGGFTGRVSYGFTDARFLRYESAGHSYAHRHIPYAPQNTLFAGLSYSRSFRRGPVERISADINVRGAGRIYWDEANSVSQPFYAIADASVRADRGAFSLELWANNITATQYSTFYFVSIGNAFLQQGTGVCCGATLRYTLPFD